MNPSFLGCSRPPARKKEPPHASRLPLHLDGLTRGKVPYFSAFACGKAAYFFGFFDEPAGVWFPPMPNSRNQPPKPDSPNLLSKPDNPNLPSKRSQTGSPSPFRAYRSRFP